MLASNERLHQRSSRPSRSRISEGGLAAGCSQFAQIAGEIVERGFDLALQRLPQNLAMFGFRRSAMTGGPDIQFGDQLVVEVSDMQITRHCFAPNEIIESKDSSGLYFNEGAERRAEN